ncbi:MAG TPA: DUF533 domain-containing protein [Candidatus Limnocylindria bacterium]|jgi:uncharacterized protein (DUF697 family)/tellurite resistance protein|nr:DUF533 domain-containing protein [Candidatus Limnocylindria bacterium]
MTDSQRQAILNLCVLAALADGSTSVPERAALQQVSVRLGLPGLTPGLADADLRSHVSAIAEAAAALRGAETARTAYEMATAICAADGPPNPAEQWFLEELHGALELPREQAQEVKRQAEAITSTPFPSSSATPGAAGSAAASAPPITLANVSAADLDRMILNNAILAGALELLPDTLATMAIVPVQMRLVYQVGKAHGYDLDRGHITDLLATVGVGLASQVVESFAERAVRGLLGGFAGGLVRGLAGQLVDSGMAFATTYALGQMARQYYAGGRRFNAIELRGLYDSLLGQGRSLRGNYAAQIRDQAGRVNLGTLTSMLRGNA